MGGSSKKGLPPLNSPQVQEKRAEIEKPKPVDKPKATDKPKAAAVSFKPLNLDSVVAPGDCFPIGERSFIHPLPLAYFNEISQQLEVKIKEWCFNAVPEEATFNKLKDRYDDLIKNSLSSCLLAYPKPSADLFVRIFSEDLMYLLLDKIFQIQGYQTIDFWNMQKSARDVLCKRQIVCSQGFRKLDLWFATYGNPPSVHTILTTKEKLRNESYAGSLYFDVGRIRLVHLQGPMIDKSFYRRYLVPFPWRYNDEISIQLTKKMSNETIFALASMLCLKIKKKGGRMSDKDIAGSFERKVVLEEYFGAEKHTSRGYPYKVTGITDEEIANLYWLIEQIEIGCGKRADSSKTTSAGNCIVYDYITRNKNLEKVLGYNYFPIKDACQFFGGKSDDEGKK